MFSLIYAFEKFWAYLVGRKVIVHTIHVNIRYLFNKKDAKPGIIRSNRLLKEVSIEVQDIKWAKNQVAHQLSRLDDQSHKVDNGCIQEEFLDEQLMAISIEDLP